VQVLYPRCAAIDIGKKEIAVCVRTPGDEPGGRRSQVRKYKTFYGVLKEMCAWLTECGVTHVAMEATGIWSGATGGHVRSGPRSASVGLPLTRFLCHLMAPADGRTHGQTTDKRSGT
jgi:hypothetical protein